MFEWRDHTAELELHIEAATETEVFAEAVIAFAELVDGEAAGGGEPGRRELSVTGSDRASLLVHWLEELIYLADAERFVPQRATSIDLGETEVRARIDGVVGSPRPLLKAVTYHALEFRPRGDGWHAKLVLDV